MRKAISSARSRPIKTFSKRLLCFTGRRIKPSPADRKVERIVVLENNMGQRFPYLEAATGYHARIIDFIKYMQVSDIRHPQGK